MAVPYWLQELRKNEVARIVLEDERTCDGRILGVPKSDVFAIAGGGQADFASPCGDLSSDDLALLYAYYFQKGHTEELVEAFSQHLTGSTVKEPVIIDLGSGPFTGGLAVASALEPPNSFTYIGMDRAPSMRLLGAKLATAAVKYRGINIKQFWTDDLNSVEWNEPPKWYPVIVIVSYLLASPTVEPVSLVADLDRLLTRIGRGPVTLLYTNSEHASKNAHFPAFQGALKEIGLNDVVKSDIGTVETEKGIRRLRYALFHRPTQDTIKDL